MSTPNTPDRAAFEAWAVRILGDNPTWQGSGDCELAWQSWQAALASTAKPGAVAVPEPIGEVVIGENFGEGRNIQIVKWRDVGPPIVTGMKLYAEPQHEAPREQFATTDCAYLERLTNGDRVHLRICMGHGKIECGDAMHEGLHALWVGNDGQGLGFERARPGRAKPNETLVIFTFENLKSIEAIEFALARVRKAMEPATPPQAPAGAQASPDAAALLESKGYQVGHRSAGRPLRLFHSNGSWISAEGIAELIAAVPAPAGAHEIERDGDTYALIATQSAWNAWKAALQAAIASTAEPRAVAVAPDDTAVICPSCAHQFRAIPCQVQQLMLDAGFEPPFDKPLQAPARAIAAPAASVTKDGA